MHVNTPQHEFVNGVPATEHLTGEYTTTHHTTAAGTGWQARIQAYSGAAAPPYGHDQVRQCRRRPPYGHDQVRQCRRRPHTTSPPQSKKQHFPFHPQTTKPPYLVRKPVHVQGNIDVQIKRVVLARVVRRMEAMRHLHKRKLIRVPGLDRGVAWPQLHSKWARPNGGAVLLQTCTKDTGNPGPTGHCR